MRTLSHMSITHPSPAVLIAVAVLVVGIVLFFAARRAMRRATAQIDTILREETGARDPRADSPRPDPERHEHRRRPSASGTV